MPNYKMKFSVSEVANILKVERNLVLKWAYLFSSYLGQPTSRLKGQPRQFSSEDLRVLAYVSMNWEDEPDLEAIKIGLNSEDHYEELFDEFLSAETPIFIDPPEELNENWQHGALYIAGFCDKFALADSYKLAGDILIDIALSKNEASGLLYPVIYNYRHSIELYLKVILDKWIISHNFNDFLPNFKQLLKLKFSTELPKWFEDIILVFNDFDPSGTTFRYGGDLNYNEKWIDFVQMKIKMNWMAISFSKIFHHCKKFQINKSSAPTNKAIRIGNERHKVDKNVKDRKNG